MFVPKRVLVALVLAGAIPATSTARQAVPRRWCTHLFTARGTEYTARRIYTGTGTVTLRALRELGYREMCLVNPRMQSPVRAFDRRQASLHAARVAAQQAWIGPVLASWFDDSGSTACGIHATYGFATLLPIPCGATITMRGPGGTVTATREDSGPYVSGRTFDLNPALKAALGCGDLCDVWYLQRS